MPAYIHESNTKTCSKCNETKPIDRFWKSKVARKDGTTGYRNYCIDCGTKERLDRYHNKGGKERQKQLSFKHNLSKYGMTVKDYWDLYEKQNCKCAICGDKEIKVKNRERLFLYVDHCHSTGKVRGLLCNHCNTLLGMAKDDVNILNNAIEYLNANTSGH